MSTNPYESPETTGQTPGPKVGCWKGILGVLALLTFIALFILPNIRGAREASRRMSCQNNLKQISLGLQNYAEEYGSLPPAYTVDEDGRPLHSWRTLILPFIEQNSLYENIDLSKPWDDPTNLEVFETRVGMYQCASSALRDHRTTYLGVVAPGGCFQPASGRKTGEITDKHGKTLMVIEVPADQAVPWMSPQDADENLILNLGNASRPSHPYGMQAACVDGSVLFLPKDLKPEILRALISIAGDDDEIAAGAD